jgi:hypothetical protein
VHRNTAGTPAGGRYTVLSITGTRNGEAITSLAAPGSLGGNDDILSPDSLFVDTAGIS